MSNITVVQSLSVYCRRSRCQEVDTMRTVLVAFLTACILSVATSAEAVAMRTNKATDDSVCDLGPQTSVYISRHILIPAVARAEDKQEMLFRYAGEFIARECRNAQLLIVHGNPEWGGDVQAMERLANSLCVVASVVKRDMTYVGASWTSPGIELRCTISKMPQFRRNLADLERADPLEAVKQRLYTPPVPSRPAAGSGSGPYPGRDCSQITLGTILLGGGSGCR